MSTTYNTSKQTFASETSGTPVIYTKQNPLYETVEALQDVAGFSGDLASDSGSHEARLKQLFAIGTHSRSTIAASGSITLPQVKTVVVTGTTTVTGIAATGNDLGRSVILDLTGECTIEDGGNLDLSGSDFVGPGRLGLICDGINWKEYARSPGGSGGHAIAISTGSDLPARSRVRFSSAFTGADDSGNDETDIDLNFGTTAGTVAEGNDSRLSDTRTPTAHAASHITGGTDIIPLFGINQRGLVPGPSSASGTKFLSDAGSWIPAASAGLPTFYDPDGVPLTTRNIIQAVGEMAKAEDATDDRTLLHFRFGKISATVVTASGTTAALPTDGNIIQVNGNTQIDTIPAPATGYENRLVILYFTGTPTVKNGTGNLYLDDDFDAIAGSMLGIWHNGVGWIEAFRSHHDAGGGGGISGIEVYDESSDLGEFTALKFIGAGVSVATATGGIAEVTINGGGGGSGLYIPSVTPTPPSVADFTWDNQGSATAVDEHDSIRFKGPSSATNQWHVLFDSLGTLPKTVTVGIVPIRIQPIQFQNFGLCVRESVGAKLQGIGLWFEGGAWQIRTINMTSSTSFSATANNQVAALFGPAYFFQVEQTSGGDRIWRISPNGLQWADWVTTTFNDFTGTPDQAGFFVASMSSSAPIDVAVIHWSVV